MSVYTKLACFAGGALFGSFGIKLLSSKDAKKAYVHVTAAGEGSGGSRRCQSGERRSLIDPEGAASGSLFS